MSEQQKIPEEIKKMALSVEIYDKAEKIGNLFGLHIDQIGELDTEIRSILLGKNTSSTSIERLTKNLEIDQKLANQIAAEVNKEIFATIKSNLQSQTISEESTITNLEHAGDFSVEKEKPIENNTNPVTYADRGKILRGLEDSQIQVETTKSNFPTFTNSSIKSERVIENYTEPLVDSLLSKPLEQKENKAVPNIKETLLQTKTIPVVPKRSGPDPYREEMK